MLLSFVMLRYVGSLLAGLIEKEMSDFHVGHSNRVAINSYQFLGQASPKPSLLFAAYYQIYGAIVYSKILVFLLDCPFSLQLNLFPGISHWTHFFSNFSLADLWPVKSPLRLSKIATNVFRRVRRILLISTCALHRTFSGLFQEKSFYHLLFPMGFAWIRPDRSGRRSSGRSERPKAVKAPPAK